MLLKTKIFTSTKNFGNSTLGDEPIPKSLC